MAKHMIPGTTPYETVRELKWDGVAYPAGTIVSVTAENLKVGSGPAHVGLVEDIGRPGEGWYRIVTLRPKDVKRA